LHPVFLLTLPFSQPRHHPPRPVHPAEHTSSTPGGRAGTSDIPTQIARDRRTRKAAATMCLEGLRWVASSTVCVLGAWECLGFLCSSQRPFFCYSECGAGKADRCLFTQNARTLARPRLHPSIYGPRTHAEHASESERETRLLRHSPLYHTPAHSRLNTAPTNKTRTKAPADPLRISLYPAYHPISFVP
jgi:hypothetical protein